MKFEPIILAAAITGAVRAVLVALVISGAITLSPEALGAWVFAIEALLAIPLALVARGKVTPNASLPQ